MNDALKPQIIPLCSPNTLFMFTFMQTLSNSWLLLFFTCLSKLTVTSESFSIGNQISSNMSLWTPFLLLWQQFFVTLPVLYEHVKIMTVWMLQYRHAEQKVLCDCDAPFQCCQTEGFEIHHVTVLFHQVKDVSGNTAALQRKLCHTNFHILKERLPVYYTTAWHTEIGFLHKTHCTSYNQPEPKVTWLRCQCLRLDSSDWCLNEFYWHFKNTK